MTVSHIVQPGSKARRAYWFRQLRAEGFNALSAWNGARARIRIFDTLNNGAIRQFVADCAADDVECSFEQAADILEERACGGAI